MFDFQYDDASNLVRADSDYTLEIDRIYRYDANNYRTVEVGIDRKKYAVYNKAGILLFESDDERCEDNAYVYLGKSLVAKDVTANGQDCSVTDVTPPVVTPPADIIAEATAIQTPVSMGTATATDDVDGPLVATPDRTGPFAIGIHTITWSADDAAGNRGSSTQTVTIQDTTSPVLTVPDDVAVISPVPLAVDLGTASATDIFEPVVMTNNAPALFPLGLLK